jgi:putative zinc finger protein
MTRCLDEAMLQSYFDGELSGEMMESATLHLASCSTCAAAAREMEEDINVLMTALAPEFEATVPSERLRERIDAAVLGERLEAASTRDKAGFGAFISSLLNFGTQRTLGFASLVVVLAFAVIFGLMKFRTTTPAPQEPVAKVTPGVVEPTVPKPVSGEIAQVPASGQVQKKNRDFGYKPVKVANKINPAPQADVSQMAHPVKLLPGERAYLQTIAKLDTTIKANQKTMRPSLQVEYQRNLAVVDRAIAATRSAAKNNPNDPDAADFMFAAYQSKVDFLNTIADARLGGGRPH